MGRQRKKDIRERTEREARRPGRKKGAIFQEPDLQRKSGSVRYYRSILIVAEGKNTEPSYFKQFRIPNVSIVTVGTGLSTCRMVREVESIVSSKYRNKNFDDIWVVFDKDDNDDFRQAIDLAHRMNYKVAYSNQAIEYWFLLHFNDHQGGAMDRSSYATLINSAINPQASYAGNKVVTPEFFECMMSVNGSTGRKRLQDAIDRADRIFRSKADKTEESVTTVYKLVGQITGMKPTRHAK